jgi:outer membrane protein assembly factor BamB
MAYRDIPQESPLLVAAFNGGVFALGRDDGKVAWSFELRGARVTRAVVQGDRIFVLGSELACLDYTTGRLLWRVAVPSAITGGTLLADGDRVFVADSGEAAAFETQQGLMLWHEPFTGHGRGVVALAVRDASAQGDRSG